MFYIFKPNAKKEQIENMFQNNTLDHVTAFKSRTKKEAVSK